MMGVLYMNSNILITIAGIGDIRLANIYLEYKLRLIVSLTGSGEIGNGQ